MHRFWNAFIEPLLQVVRPRGIIEIGSDEGGNTRLLLAWCARHDAILHVIDPLPKYDPGALHAGHAERLVFLRGLSLERLGDAGPAELVLIDGDHNWHTVYHELHAIERRMNALASPMPCIVLHDVGWPYGRRDLYYDPETIPEENRRPHARKGLCPGSRELAANGGMNPHLEHALEEGSQANGVLTALEDYLKQSGQDWRWIRLEGIHGLGVLIPEVMIQAVPALAAFAAQWTLPEAVTAFQWAIEQDRLHIETERQTQRRKVLEQARLLREHDEQARALREKLTGLERINRETAEKLGQELTQSRKALEKAVGQIESAHREAENERQARHELEKTGITLRERCEALEKQLRDGRETARALQADMNLAQARINEEVRERCSLENELRERESALERAGRENRQATERIGQLEDELQAARQQIDGLGVRLAEASRREEIARRQLLEQSQDINRLTHRLDEAGQAAGRLREQAKERFAAGEREKVRLHEELRAMRERESQLAESRRKLEQSAQSHRLDMRRFYFGRQMALARNAYVAVDYLSRYRLLRRAGTLGLSIAKRLAPGLRKALCEAKRERARLARQKALQPRKGCQRRIEKYLGVAAKHRDACGKPKISVIAWDMGHNPLGRAYLLADLFHNRSFDAELIGPQFPRYGKDLWQPLRNMRIPHQRFPGRMFPEHFADLERMAVEIDGDVIYVSKPRIPSLLLGILAKMRRNRPLVLDIDDHELAFFEERTPLTLDGLKAAAREGDFLCPHGNLWTRYAETLIGFADHITVSNAELHKKYGGTILPHVRNGEHFNPELYDRDAIRASLGFSPDDRVILFIGTPRLHKGLLEIIDALDEINNYHYKLCIIGSVVDREVRQRLDAAPEGRVRCFPDAPFEALPRNLCAGDLICILQDPVHAVSAFQMPAKVSDALMMGIPMLATDAPPLRALAAQGLVETLGGQSLARRIDEIFSDYPACKARAEINRRTYGRDFAYRANREKLWSVFENIIENPRPVADECVRLVSFLRETFQGRPAELPPAEITVDLMSGKDVKERRGLNRHRPLVDEKINIVFFWKQNDSDLYGRRQDMMVKYLAAHPNVNSIIHFDAPIEYGAWMKLMNLRKGRKYDQRGFIFRHTLKRLLGLSSKGNVFRKTYVYLKEKDRRNGILRKLFGHEGGYLEYVGKTLDGLHAWDRRTVFWVCPANFQFPLLIERFSPDLVLADVIDDQREWPCRGNFRQRLKDNYNRILSSSDIVIANCENVARSMNEFRQGIEVIPNACEYLNGRLPSLVRPGIYRKMRGPVIGYVGNLDASRLDIELFDYLVRKRPGWNFVLIGSVHMNRDILDLQRHGNIHFLGVIPYEKALPHIRHFDVAIIPHIDNGMTRMMNPLKAYVYCSLDVPVVSTAISNLDAMKDLIHVAHSRSAFLKKIEMCLNKGKNVKRPEDVDELLRQNSWQARVNDVMSRMLAHPSMARD